MKVRGNRRLKNEEAELDITSFMNLMIVLVPVLLMMMVFSRITVIELNLPGVSENANPEDLAKEVLEVHLTKNSLDVYFPQGYLVESVPVLIADSIAKEGDQANLSYAPNYDFQSLQTILKQMKQTLLAKNVDKKDITLLLPPDTDYQTIVTLIDTTRSYKEVVINSVVDAELFPEVSLGDAISKSAGVTSSETASKDRT
ncbi:ExbD/TolR family protein [Agaribacter flavus]|uniref:ExbD/TolR family protein n=1 Tax=Agaribacter flavus TaxID=1902781 RepID=A0ABV7FP28_9ALTE